MSVTHPGQPPLTAGELGLCTPPADPVAAAATEAYVAAWRSPNGAAVGAAVSAGVAEALRQAGIGQGFSHTGTITTSQED